MADPYAPPSPADSVLDTIASLFTHPKTTIIKESLIGKKFLCKLPGGQLYFESALQLDTDGSAYSKQDGTGQAVTSARDAAGKSMDSDKVNFFVLPLQFYARHGISMGDIGVVIRDTRVAYACFADAGPRSKLGEGSIALHRALGHETIQGGKLRNVGIAGGVITIVFPGSGNGLGRANAESQATGQPLFHKLLLEGDAHLRERLQRLKRREIFISGNRQELDFQLVDWMQEVVESMPHPDGSAHVTPAFLVLTASGIDMVIHAPPSMTLPDKPNPKGRSRTVHAEFKIERTTDGRWYVGHVHFSVPMTAAEHSTTVRRVLEERL